MEAVLVGIGVLMLIGLVLLIRDLNGWYWKINARLKAAEQTNIELQALNTQMRELLTRLPVEEPVAA